MNSHSSRTTHGRLGAFTLVELLSVIAILGILAAILIPTVGAVRATAHQATCAGNLRQIAVAVISYANENRGQLPGGRDTNGAYNGTYRGIVPPGLRGLKSVDVLTGREEGNAQLSGLIANYLDTGKDTNVWLCPGNTEAYDQLANGTTYICNNQSDTTPSYFFGQYGGSTPERRTPKRLTEQLQATSTDESNYARLWMVSDIDSVNYTGSTGLPAGFDAPHKGARNYAFFDGHVEARKADNFPINP